MFVRPSVLFAKWIVVGCLVQCWLEWMVMVHVEQVVFAFRVLFYFFISTVKLLCVYVAGFYVCVSLAWLAGWMDGWC